jgi:lysyl-tRNA synthetase class 1
MDEQRDRVKNKLVPFAHLATIAQTFGNDVDAAIQVLEEGGYREDTTDRKSLAENLEYARNWAQEWAPESYRVQLLDLAEVRYEAGNLSDTQRSYLEEAAYNLSLLGDSAEAQDGEIIQDILYDTVSEFDLKPQKAFAAVYTALLGKKNGPKAGPYIAQIGIWQVQKRFLRASQEPGRSES